MTTSPTLAFTPETLRQHSLTLDEYEKIKQLLGGREPTLTELGIFSVMWSEHCSYKSSRVHLRRLPTTGPRVIQGPGENAGVVDIGDGYAAVFKMGARPIAGLNSLRFGRPDHPRTAELLHGVVAGIGGYGNCIGVPTVG